VESKVLAGQVVYSRIADPVGRGQALIGDTLGAETDQTGWRQLGRGVEHHGVERGRAHRNFGPDALNVESHRAAGYGKITPPFSMGGRRQRGQGQEGGRNLYQAHATQYLN